MFYTLHKVSNNAEECCETKIISKGQILLQEGGICERLFIVREGQVSFFKRLPRQNFVEKNCYQEMKIYDLGPGDIFGEDKLVFKCPNRFTVKVTSLKAVIVSIKLVDFQKQFKGILSSLNKSMKVRN